MANCIYEHQNFWKINHKIVLTDYEAICIAEGFIKEENQERITAAWQHLTDKGIDWKSRERFGEKISEMINQGIISPQIQG